MSFQRAERFHFYPSKNLLIEYWIASHGGTQFSTKTASSCGRGSEILFVKFQLGFRNKPDGGWHRLHGTLTPCGSRRSPPLPATAHGPSGPLHARTVAGRMYHYPDVQIIATSLPRLAVRQWTAPPFPPLSAGSWPVPFARLFPFGLHIKRIRLTYSVLGCRQLA